jgi:hypothetical protein
MAEGNTNDDAQEDPDAKITFECGHQEFLSPAVDEPSIAPIWRSLVSSAMRSMDWSGRLRKAKMRFLRNRAA